MGFTGLSGFVDKFFEGLKENLTNRALEKAAKDPEPEDPLLIEHRKELKRRSEEYKRLMRPHK